MDAGPVSAGPMLHPIGLVTHQITSPLLRLLYATRQLRRLSTQTTMATTQFAFSSPPRSSLSSSPLPSPGAVIRQFCRATNTKTKTEPDVYDIPDDDEPPVEKPPAKSTATAERKVAELVIKKPRAPTVKKKTAKKTVDDGTKSKYFMELEEPEKGEPQKPKPARRLAVRKKATIATATDSVATTAAPPKARRKKVEPKDKAKTTVAPEAPVIEAAPAPETTTIESSPVRRRVWTPPVEDTIVISSGIEKEGEPKQTTSFIKIGDLAYKPASPQEGAEPVPNIKTATGAPASPRKRRIEVHLQSCSFVAQADLIPFCRWSTSLASRRPLPRSRSRRRKPRPSPSVPPHSTGRMFRLPALKSPVTSPPPRRLSVTPSSRRML